MFAVNCSVEIRVEQTPHPGQGQDVDSSGLNCKARGRTLVDAPHPSATHSLQDERCLSAWYLSVHPPTHPLAYFFIHLAFIVCLTLWRSRDKAVVEMDTDPPHGVKGLV